MQLQLPMMVRKDDGSQLKTGTKKLVIWWIERLRWQDGSSSSMHGVLPSASTFGALSSGVTMMRPSSSTSEPATPMHATPMHQAEIAPILGEKIEETLTKYVKPQMTIKGDALVAKLKAGGYYTTAERNFLVKVLGRRLMRTCAVPDRPSSVEKLALAKEITSTFPVLKDDKTPNGYETFFDPRAHCGYLENYIRNKRSRDPEITATWMHRKKSFVTVATPDDDERMLREMRPNSSNVAELLKLMDQTRASRRNWIHQERPTITAILKRYPRLQDMNIAIWEEFAAIIPEEARTMKLRVEWHRLRDNVLDVAKSRADSRDLRDLLSSITNDCDEESSFRAIPHLLPVPPQKGKMQPRLSPQAVEEMFFFEVQDEVAVDTVVRKLTQTQPVLFRCQGRLWVKMDSSALEIADISCFADAVELLIATFFVFNVEYPYHLKPTFEFFEAILKMRRSPQAVVARDLLRSLGV